jgi:hypothetical protein
LGNTINGNIFNKHNDQEKKTLVKSDHTKNRPGQLETARDLEITPVVLEYCLNQIFVEIIMEYDVK